MDLYCPVCAEPWDNDVIHDVAAELDSTYTVVARNFHTRGCGSAFKGSEYSNSRCTRSDDPGQQARAECSSMLYELMGDDTDGIMSGMDDAENLGLFESRLI